MRNPLSEKLQLLTLLPPQLEEMAEHRELAPGVVRVTYGNGDRIYVNHTQAAASPDGVSVPAQDFVFLPAR